MSALASGATRNYQRGMAIKVKNFVSEIKAISKKKKKGLSILSPKSWFNRDCKGIWHVLLVIKQSIVFCLIGIAKGDGMPSKYPPLVVLLALASRPSTPSFYLYLPPSVYITKPKQLTLTSLKQ